MVCVDAYSKWVELIPIPDKKGKHVAAAFRRHVISRWGAPAEVVSDKGVEFGDEFEQLLRQCLIDKRPTSGNHPQANGAAERVVQTVKKSLTKMVEQSGTTEEWESNLDGPALGDR